jgi:hypothetical protein
VACFFGNGSFWHAQTHQNMANARTAPTPFTVIETRRETMKKVRIELRWEWKLEGAWGATIVMVALLQLPHLPLWFGLI